MIRGFVFSEGSREPRLGRDLKPVTLNGTQPCCGFTAMSECLMKDDYNTYHSHACASQTSQITKRLGRRAV